MLIAESGSTKTEWRLFKGSEVVTSFRSKGFNPNVQKEESILKKMRKAVSKNIKPKKVQEVYFYGAGLGGQTQRQIMYKILHSIFPFAQLEVNHDIAAASRSTGRRTGIVCILGTGSNSCYYRDYQVESIIGGHGYLFGDEGSGADLGKHLVKGFLDKDFPKEARTKFEEAVETSVYKTKIKVMKSDTPNVDMAKFAPIVEQLRTYPEINQMVTNRFVEFLKKTVMRYPDYENLHTDFVGSISHYFRDNLIDACQLCKVRHGDIIKEPIHNLLWFHTKQFEGISS